MLSGLWALGGFAFSSFQQTALNSGHMWFRVGQALYQNSTSQISIGFASLLPGGRMAIVALLNLHNRRLIFNMILRRADWHEIRLCAVCIDRRLVAELSPTLLATRTACSYVITGLLVGLSAFNGQSTSLSVRSVLAYIPNILGAVLVLVVGNTVARFLARTVLIYAAT